MKDSQRLGVGQQTKNETETEDCFHCKVLIITDFEQMVQVS